ncbi:MAG: MFS transporter, partial [Propionibacteriales bacterium]|nr:MFS transporter [Propionibacteriales bacterium]
QGPGWWDMRSLGRGFGALWGANAASNLADGLAFVAMSLLAASLTGDPRWVAGLATTYALVRLLVALPVGVWVDRVDRRSILVAANLLRGLVVLLLGVVLHGGLGSLLVLYVAFALVGALESAADNAALALVPSIVGSGDLDHANGRISATQLLADEFIGPPLGGLLFAVSMAAPVLAMGGLWAVAGLLALAVPTGLGAVADAAAPPVRRSLLREAADGVRWLATDRIVGGLALIGGAASVGYMLPFSILVLFAEDRLGVDEFGFGLILAVSALGGLVGSFSTARIRARIGYRWTIVCCLFVGAGALFGLSLSTSGMAAAGLLAVYICHATVWGICVASLRQRLVPEALRGRVNAATRVVGLIGLVIGSALGGFLAVIDLALPVAVGGVVFVLCAVGTLIILRAGDGVVDTTPV